MKGLPMPISSPSRAENFAPPLLRFSRSNTASRSRGRSRSSPMFYIRSKRTAAEAAQEPSSPKVTCFGQVRAVKSKAKTISANRRRCWLRRKTSGNISLGFRRQIGVFRRIFCNYEIFTKWSYCRGVDATEDSIVAYSDRKSNQLPRNPHPGNAETKAEFLDDSIPVPKNALILTRCRSAPYRSSSLGGRIWGSPFPESETASDAKSDSQTAICKFESRIKVSHEIGNGLRNSTSHCVEEESKETAGDAIHPLLLTRCNRSQGEG